MTWPRKLDVTINHGDDKQSETSATLIRSTENLYQQYGPHAEYETASGQRFWIDGQYMQLCQDTKAMPDIPIEVINKNSEIKNKLEYGNQALAKQAVEKTGIILPPGYEIPKV